MSKTWLQLKNEIRSQLFVSGESSNLVKAHDAAFLAAIIDIQTWCECNQQDNVSIFPQCSTLYDCGITVFDAPRGRIKKVSVVDSKTSIIGAVIGTNQFNASIFGSPITGQICAIANAGTYVVTFNAKNAQCAVYSSTDPQYFLVSIAYTASDGSAKTVTQNLLLNSCDQTLTSTIECAAGSVVTATITPFNTPFTDGGSTITISVNQQTSAADIEWCDEIEYRQTDPRYIQNYWAFARRRRFCPSIPFFFDLPFDLCGLKNFPPVPTDAGLPTNLPILPLGFHYPQDSTNKRYRSRIGLWAIERQKIYIVPWINSTEIVLVKWDGIKRSWADADPIDDDPLLAEAIRHYVRWDNYKYWERDPTQAFTAEKDYNEARAKLIHECREETRVRGQEPSFARQSSPTQVGSLFYNSEQSYTANCPSGTTGSPVSITIPAGSVSSALSQADANATALAQAQLQAQAQLSCVTTPVTYLNAAQSFTAVCTQSSGSPIPDGSPQTITINAGVFSSTISQADADSQALAAATQQANSQLTCTFWNSEQSFTASCPQGSTGSDVTETTAAHTFSSTLSQSDADAQALVAAQNEANNALVCTGSPPVFSNTPQTATRQFSTSSSGGGFCMANVTVNVSAGTFTSVTSQAAANLQAIGYATSLAQATAQQRAGSGQCGNFTLNV